MAYAGSYYHDTAGPVSVSYQYQPQHTYPYDQQYQQYQQHQEYQQYPPPPPYQPQPSQLYQQPAPYSNNYNNQWHGSQQNYDYRSTSTAPPPQQQQQYVPAHAPCAPPQAVQYVPNTNMHYQYSSLRGKRKALLIGCNYPGGSAPLGGCINDVHNIKDFLIQGYRFQPQNMWIMTDDLSDPRSIPTKNNILIGMQWLVANAQPGDELFLHFSGHGGPVEDKDGDEEDGFDEAIFPTDAEKIQNGYITDDVIHEICVKPLPEGTRLCAIFDCCHSGSIMDLPYTYSTKGVLKEPSFIKDTGLHLLHLGSAYVQEDLGAMIVGGASLLKKVAKAASGHRQKVKEAKTSAADVICFSGCKDEQTSTDAHILTQRQGAMSHAFKTSLVKHGGNLTYIQLLNAIRQELIDGGFQQKPQLSASHPIDLDLTFTL